ncbi:MAG: hypothetical protein JXL80_04580 [Planctomycetes bacterium]|nr:hypothetical protein [Planctomycetota bacterium]
MSISPHRICGRRTTRRGYTLMIVVGLIACLAVFVGVFFATASLTMNRRALASRQESARWAAEAGVEEALGRLVAAKGTLDAAQSRFVTGSNHCRVEVAIEDAEAERLQITSEAVWEGDEDVERLTGRATVVAAVARHATDRRLSVVSWNEQSPSDAETAPPP